MDSQYSREVKPNGEVDTAYPEWVHISGDTVVLSQLAEVSKFDLVNQVKIRRMFKDTYTHLIHWVLKNEFPTKIVEINTRMINYHQEAVWKGQVLKKNTNVAVAQMQRAGGGVAEDTFLRLSSLLNHSCVKLHAIPSQRKEYSGGLKAEISAEKIDRIRENTKLIVPDPMAATGSTSVQLLDYYLSRTIIPEQVIFVHLVGCPEYITRLKDYVIAKKEELGGKMPRITVYLGRLDRGFSSQDVLALKPGEDESEKGLNERGYIVPGLGDAGALLCNTPGV